MFGVFGSSSALPPRRETMASKWNGRKAVRTPVAMPAGCEAARLRSEKQAFGGRSDRAVSPRDRPGVAETEASPEEAQAGGDKLSARFVGARSAGDSIVGMQRV